MIRFLLSIDVINSLLLHSCCGDACVRSIRRTSDDDEGEGSSVDGADREGSGHDSGADSTSEDGNVTTQGLNGVAVLVLVRRLSTLRQTEMMTSLRARLR
jgi:hypothetical protein